MNRTRASLMTQLLTAGLALVFGAMPAMPQTASSDLVRVEQALLRIAEILEDQTRQTHTTLLLSRLEIENRDVRELDSKLSVRRSELEQLLLEHRSFVAMIDHERERIEREVTDVDERLDQLRDLQQGDTQLEALATRRASLEQEVIQLDNQVHDAVIRRDTLRAEIDEILGIDQR